MFRALDFEVFGRVQGVFFRKYTKEQADKLGLRGWCKNTAQGTVLGHMQGTLDKIEVILVDELSPAGVKWLLEPIDIYNVKCATHLEMMNWLKTTGSPSSKIDKVEFRNVKEISELTYDNFSIAKDH